MESEVQRERIKGWILPHKLQGFWGKNRVQLLKYLSVFQKISLQLSVRQSIMICLPLFLIFCLCLPIPFYIFLQLKSGNSAGN